jgi:hypothetical protein
MRTIKKYNIRNKFKGNQYTRKGVFMETVASLSGHNLRRTVESRKQKVGEPISA